MVRDALHKSRSQLDRRCQFHLLREYFLQFQEDFLALLRLRLWARMLAAQRQYGVHYQSALLVDRLDSFLVQVHFKLQRLLLGSLDDLTINANDLAG